MPLPWLLPALPLTALCSPPADGTSSPRYETLCALRSCVSIEVNAEHGVQRGDNRCMQQRTPRYVIVG